MSNGMARAALVAAQALLLTVSMVSNATADSTSTTTHTSEVAAGQSLDKQDAHDIAYSKADSLLKLACAAVALSASGTYSIENEQEDSTDYTHLFNGEWLASITIEGDCVVTSSQ